MDPEQTLDEARARILQCEEASALKDIERGLSTSDFGVNPMNDGKAIRLPLPQALAGQCGPPAT